MKDINSKLLRMKSQMYQRLTPTLLKPSEVLVNLTYRCNLRCKMCLVWKRQKSELPTSDWIRIFTDLYDSGFKNIHFQGGEPFLRKDWYELAELSRDLGYNVSVVTNGTLLHLYRDKLKIFDYIDVSLDSLKKHDMIRGKGAFHKVINNMELLRELNIPFGINSVIMPINYKEIPDLIRFAREKGATSLNLILVSLSAFTFGNEVVDRQLIDFNFKELENLYKFAIRYPLVVNSSRYYNLYIKRALKGPTKARCISPYMRINVEPDGEVGVCCGNLPSVGSLTVKSFKEIWDSELYRNTRLKALEGSHPICQRCLIGDIGIPTPLLKYIYIYILKIIGKKLLRFQAHERTILM